MVHKKLFLNIIFMSLCSQIYSMDPANQPPNPFAETPQKFIEAVQSVGMALAEYLFDQKVTDVDNAVINQALKSINEKEVSADKQFALLTLKLSLNPIDKMNQEKANKMAAEHLAYLMGYVQICLLSLQPAPEPTPTPAPIPTPKPPVPPVPSVPSVPVDPKVLANIVNVVQALKQA